MNRFSVRVCVTAVALALASVAANAAVNLPQLNIDKTQTSVSGLSSGGFMAVQLHVGHSATFKKGAGIVAGGPFYCAEGSITNATGRCMASPPAFPPAPWSTPPIAGPARAALTRWPICKAPRFTCSPAP
jgi:poly(3-hydroxybutyrate) depolymerase